MISPNSSKLIHLSSISQRSFSRSPLSSQTARGPLSDIFKNVISGGTETDTNHGVAESAQSSEKLRDNGENAKTLQMEKKEKESLWVLFTGRNREQSELKNWKRKLESASVERIAYGVEDPTVQKELSPDMKMFAEHLYEKGYFKNPNFIPGDGFDASRFEVSYARQFLKSAAMRFGKRHPEIARQLSAEDLKTVVAFGCPSLAQTAVFPAKNMRKFFKIDEHKVCHTCALKKLCDYRYEGSNDPATELRMANVMRVLLMYAMETLPQELVVPEEVKNSVSRLLNEVTTLSRGTW